MQNIKQMMELASAQNVQGTTKSSSTGFASKKFNDFGKVMSKQVKDTNTVSSGKKIVVNKDATAVQVVNDKRQGQLQGDTVENVLTEGVNEETISKEIAEKVPEWLNQVKQQLCDTFDLDVKELEDIMSQLGLQFSDLLNVNNLQQFVLSQAGCDDAIMLLTDENLGTQFQEILQSIDDVTMMYMQPSEGSQETFQAIVKEFEAVDLNSEDVVMATDQTVEEMPVSDGISDEIVSDNTDTAEVDTTISSETDLDVQEDVVTNDVLEPTNSEVIIASEKSVVQSTKQEDVSPVKQDDQVEEAFSVEDGQEKLSETFQNTLETETDGKEFSQEKDGNSSTEHQKTEKPLFDQIITNTSSTNEVGQVEVIQEKVEVIQQFREVVEQVVTQIKVAVTEDTSEMSMQLNPENLGKVNLSVVTKEGHITAQFVTETEVARQALESQIQQLRETLGQQGLKVDKVEVSVSDFSFQQGNETNAEEQKEQQRNGYAKQLHRNLNLEHLDDLSELSEKEQLAIKIMQSNGNQIDFTA